MSKCTTSHGPYRCDKDEGHKDECETVHGPKASMFGPIDYVDRLRADREELERQLANAVTLYNLERETSAKLRAALEEIRTTPCEKDGVASCLCCLHDRMIASAALGVGS